MFRIVLMWTLGLVVCSEAAAKWKSIRSAPGEYLLSLSTLSDMEFFVSGMRIDKTQRLPLPEPLLYWTQDGGQLLKSILGNLPTGLGAGIPEVVRFRDSLYGIVAVGEHLYLTTQRGAKWQMVGPKAEVNDLVFLEGNKVVAVGGQGVVLLSEDGGQSWEQVQAHPSAQLFCVRFVDGARGFAAGAVPKVASEGDDFGDGTEEDSIGIAEGVFLVTTDGGRTWSETFAVTGVALCPIAFTANGQLVVVGGSEANEGEPERATARLYVSHDGGQSFEEASFDPKVGQLQFFVSMPINLAFAAAIYVEDEYRWHLAGPAFIAKVTEGLTGSEKKIYRIADFITRDGGKTWQKTDLGLVQINLREGSMPDNDGMVTSGHFFTMFSGYMVGEDGHIWVYEYECQSHEECGQGYFCNEGHKCEKLSLPPAKEDLGQTDPGQYQVSEEVHWSPDLPRAEGAEAYQDLPGDSGVKQRDGTGGSSGGGCAANTSAGSWGPTIVLFLCLIAITILRPSHSNWTRQ